MLAERLQIGVLREPEHGIRRGRQIPGLAGSSPVALVLYPPPPALQSSGVITLTTPIAASMPVNARAARTPRRPRGSPPSPPTRAGSPRTRLGAPRARRAPPPSRRGRAPSAHATAGAPRRPLAQRAPRPRRGSARGA